MASPASANLEQDQTQKQFPASKMIVFLLFYHN